MNLIRKIFELPPLEYAWDFQLNWAKLTLCSFFIVYGYFGAYTPGIGDFVGGVTSFAAHSILLIAITLYFHWLSVCKSDAIIVNVRFKFTDLAIFLILLLFNSTLLSWSLGSSLFSDELSYSASAHGHSLFLTLKLAEFFPSLYEVEFRIVAQALSALLLISLVCICFVYINLSSKHAIWLIILALLICRAIFVFKGGNGSPHPPLQYLPLLAGGVIFGINDFAFKFSYLLSFIFFLVVLRQILSRTLSPLSSFIVLLVISSMPLVITMSTVVEHSFWSFICSTAVFLYLFRNVKLHYFGLVSCISLFTLMRQPAFICLFPVLVVFLCKEMDLKNLVSSGRNCIFQFSPVLIFAPFLLKSIIYGTPATEPIEEIMLLNDGQFFLIGEQFLQSLTNEFPSMWLILLGVSVIPFCREDFLICSILSLFLVLAFFVYHSIDTSLWALSKYKLEYIVPAMVVTIVRVSNHFEHVRYVGKLVPMCLVILCFFNLKLALTGPIGYPQNFKKNLEAKSIYELAWLQRGYSSLSYEYKQAYDYVISKGLAGKVLSVGATYGVLPEIINKMSIGQVIYSNRLYDRYKNKFLNLTQLSNDAELLTKDSAVSAIMVGSSDLKKDLQRELLNRDWKVGPVFYNQAFGTTVKVFVRN